MMQRAFWTTLGTLFLMASMAGVSGHIEANVQQAAGPQQLAWVGRDGRVLDRIGQPLDSITGVAISADASSIAVRGRLDGNDDIWIYDVASGSRTRVTDHEAAERHPGWTPDGRISYFSYRNGPADLYIRQADGSGAEEELVIAPHHQYAPTWSPDGRYVVFHEHNEDTDGRDLKYIEVGDNATLRTFIQSEGFEALPRFSPDGRYVAYMANGTGEWEAYVKAFPTGDVLRISPDGGAWPHWNAAGDELFYFEGDTLMVVSFSSRDTASAGPPRPLFSAGQVAMNPRALGGFNPTFDVAPDGQRFVVVQQLSGDRP